MTAPHADGSTRREPRGSRLRSWARAAGAAAVAGPLAASCADLSLLVSQRIGNFTGGVAGLPAAQGWAELPVGRWLQESEVRVTGVSVCRPEICDRPGMAARLALQGRERAMVARIAERPESLAARPTARSARELAARRKEKRGPTRVSRLTVGDWSGALFALLPATPGGRAAHVVILARPADSAALVAAAEDAETAIDIARAASFW